jgi:hypothetical protein
MHGTVVAFNCRFKDQVFDADQVSVMIHAYESARKKLGLRRDNAPETEKVASMVIRLVHSGALDQSVICQEVVDQFAAALAYQRSIPHRGLRSV